MIKGTEKLSAKDLTPEKMGALETQLATLNERSQELADANPAVAEQIAKKAANGLAQMRQAKLHLDMGLNPEKVIEAMGNAVELYNDGVSLRKELIHKKLRNITGPAGSMEADFDVMRDMIAPDAGKDDPRVAALGSLKKIAKDLDAEQNNPFFVGYKNKEGKDRVEVNFQLVNKARKEIADLRKIGINDPIFDKIETSLGFIEGVDPIRSGYNRMNQIADQMKGEFNWKPLRILGAISGLVVTAFGAGSALISGEMPTWPTALWAGILAVSARPDILQNNEARGKQVLAEFNAPTVSNLMTIGRFSGERGADAFSELRTLSKNGKLKELLPLKEINNAQVALVAGEGSALAKRLAVFPNDTERATALKVLNDQIVKGNGAVAEEIIRAKDKVG